MITAYSDEFSFAYKAAFDGLDLLKSVAGQELVNPLLANWIRSHHGITDLTFAEEFVRTCVDNRRKGEPDPPVPIGIRDKYEIGLFTTSLDNCFDHPYFLFNRDALLTWECEDTKVLNQTFLVRPSRDRNGVINELGFRILDTATVRSAFKWTFMCGQRATYGLEACTSENITVVEGAWDQIAFAESGVRNVVGLGGVSLSDGHRAELQGYAVTECWDSDHYGIASRGCSGNPYCFFAPGGKDPFDAWVSNGHVALVPVS